ncbi:MAG: 4Fe-4S binding protein [Chloroflexi bacterium]|nr:4Fe-4S binding protein [Chloroflexota bacterium]
MTRYDITPILQPFVKNRLPQFIMQAIALGGFLFAIIAGLIGTPVGNRNFSIVFVWIGWWALLMLIAVPLFGRAWCSVCPIPLAGEWLQHGAMLKPNGKGLGLNLRWHNKFRNIWLQNISFTLVALFSAVVLTQPNITSIALIAFLFVAFAASLIFERRAFCRYLCPVGGFIGLYSQVAPVEVRVKDSTVCAAHTEKSCYTGNAEGYGCPWQVYPGALTKNTYCGTCMECLRTCPHDNVAIQIRPLGDDLLNRHGRKLDEAFKAFIMLGSAIVYSAVMLGSWGQLKAAAYAVGTSAWALYAITFLVFIFGALPASFFIATSFNRKSFVNFAYALVPLGLLAWIAFSLSFVFANASYLLPAISDPFGWGWNLFGTVNFKWTPFLTQVTPTLQVVALIIGLAWSSQTAMQIGEQIKARAQGVIAFCFVITLGMLWLLVG